MSPWVVQLLGELLVLSQLGDCWNNKLIPNSQNTKSPSEVGVSRFGLVGSVPCPVLALKLPMTPMREEGWDLCFGGPGMEAAELRPGGEKVPPIACVPPNRRRRREQGYVCEMLLSPGCPALGFGCAECETSLLLEGAMGLGLPFTAQEGFWGFFPYFLLACLILRCL